MYDPADMALAAHGSRNAQLTPYSMERWDLPGQTQIFAGAGVGGERPGPIGSWFDPTDNRWYVCVRSLPVGDVVIYVYHVNL